MDFTSDDQDVAMIGEIDYNFFMDPYNIEFIFRSREPADVQFDKIRNLKTWIEIFNFDINYIKPRDKHNS